jgi:hypothetical protein
MPPLRIALPRQLNRSRQSVVSTHAADELDDDGLSVLDLESIILTGLIVDRHRGRISRELKVVVRGQDLAGATRCTVARIVPTGRANIITVYVEG